MQIPLYAIFNLEDERGRDNFISLVDLLTKEGIVLKVTAADISKMITVEFSVSSECISFGEKTESENEEWYDLTSDDIKKFQHYAEEARRMIPRVENWGRNE